MAEENQVPENTPNDTPPPEANPVEQEALALGWKPKEEFEADEKNAGKKWRSAEDFMDRKSLFDKIESQSHELKTLKKGLQSFAQHYTNVEKAAFQRAFDALKAERREALQDGELVKAEDIKEKMDDLKQKIETAAPPVAIEQEPAEFVEWKERNTWYKTDSKMTKFADDLGRRLHLEGMSPAEVLKEVEVRTKAAYADKFQNPNRSAAPQMVNPGRKAEPARETFRLSEDERRIMKNMVRTGIMTEDQYIADLKKMRGN